MSLHQATWLHHHLRCLPWITTTPLPASHLRSFRLSQIWPPKASGKCFEPPPSFSQPSRTKTRPYLHQPHSLSQDCSHAVCRDTTAFLTPDSIHRPLFSLSLPLIIRRVGCCPRPLSQADPPHFSIVSTFTTFIMVAWRLLALATTLLAAIQPVVAASDTRYVTTTNSAGQVEYLAGQ